jgi:hypothetical protein
MYIMTNMDYRLPTKPAVNPPVNNPPTVAATPP